MRAAAGESPSDPLSEEYIPEDCSEKKDSIPKPAPEGKTGTRSGCEEDPDKKAKGHTSPYTYTNYIILFLHYNVNKKPSRKNR